MTPTNNLFLIRKNNDWLLQKITDKVSFSVLKDEMLEVVFILFNNTLDVEVDLKEEGAHCNLKCVYLASDKNKIDINLAANHLCSNTISTQTIKGVVSGNATVHFNGVIHMARDAQKCEGYQNHHGILLSDKAKIQAVPELEIYADDVKCAHGSAVGPLNKDELFYMMARGVSEKEAQKILLKGFLCDLIPENYHNIIDDWMEQHV